MCVASMSAFCYAVDIPYKSRLALLLCEAMAEIVACDVGVRVRVVDGMDMKEVEGLKLSIDNLGFANCRESKSEATKETFTTVSWLSRR